MELAAWPRHGMPIVSAIGFLGQILKPASGRQGDVVGYVTASAEVSAKLSA
jgi:hypothetical protein